MATTATKTTNKAKLAPATPVAEEYNVIVQKTFRMAETLKKYPLPRK